jgi:hypothetical protein
MFFCYTDNTKADTHTRKQQIDTEFWRGKSLKATIWKYDEGNG